MTLAKVVLVFISYSHTDTDVALAVYHRLRAAGCRVWQDTELRAGQQWTREVERQIDKADVIVTLVSPASYDSFWVRAEQLRALRKRKRVVAVVLDPAADVPLTLEGLHRVSLDTLTTEIKCKH